MDNKIIEKKIYKPIKTHILWNYEEKVNLPRLEIKHVKQGKKDCVPCCLAMLTGTDKTEFYDIDSCNPIEWSQRLKKYKMKLAFCNYEFRQLYDYHEQLQKGTYLVGILKGDDIGMFNGTANKHLIIIQDGYIYDSFVNCIYPIKLINSLYEQNFVNRLYRVVDNSYPHEI